MKRNWRELATKTDVGRYVNTLSPELQKVYTTVSELVLIIRDTGGEDFQVAAGIEKVFWERAQEKKDWEIELKRPSGA